ncbi:Polycomb enhancer protein [Klebsormidium nitens]|uniref:Enhancer of polycomb-like protein n=1 Tax=Klebsormidium nitens TaxID=105231 RepID=A0A1Y1IS28_KLENI|nr:Polycomb enhancer protein [Klebsormidium nitens]|eukprot:GAQ90948.1 Polycomb enhancer protein [Klebsormidium nitens]
MSNRTSFRPRPLDTGRQLPLVRSLSELDNDEALVSRSVHHSHITLDAENEEVLKTSNSKGVSEIPVPDVLTVPSYETDYTPTFKQPQSYIRSKPARSETETFVEYDLDDEDEDWLGVFNQRRRLLAPEKFEAMLYRLEIGAAKFQEKAGVQVGVPNAPLPTQEMALETLRQSEGGSRPAILCAVYEYWKDKRERWNKPILRRLQPPPSVTDQNPFNVFRPRERVHRPHTRRMQRHENDLPSYEKMLEMKNNLKAARSLLTAIQKREKKKRELTECEMHVQRLQMRQRHDPDADNEDLSLSAMLQPRVQKIRIRNSHIDNAMRAAYDHDGGHLPPDDLWRPRLPLDLDGLADADGLADPARAKKRKRRKSQHGKGKGGIRKIGALAPVEPLEHPLLFAQPLNLTHLQAVGINLPEADGLNTRLRCRARIGRGGRIVFDRFCTVGRPHRSGATYSQRLAPEKQPLWSERVHSPDENRPVNNLYTR